MRRGGERYDFEVRIGHVSGCYAGGRRSVRGRAENGLLKFCVRPALQRAARAHSKEMIDKDYFSHGSANGQDFSVRVKRFGYNWRTIGENIAWGSNSLSSPENRFEGWMNSPGQGQHLQQELPRDRHRRRDRCLCRLRQRHDVDRRLRSSLELGVL